VVTFFKKKNAGGIDMTIVKNEPFGRISTLQDRINRLFQDSMLQSEPLAGELTACSWQPAVDVYNTEAGITIKAEIPGVKKEDVSVELRDNVLTLKGFRADDEDIEEDEYYRRERCFGLFHRSFTLESAINPDSIKARFESGVLEVKVPKPEKVKPESITVNIE
jgi:HSP20 family protein